jgi:hypothetical protein
MLAEVLTVLAPFTLVGPTGDNVASFQMGGAEGSQFPSLYMPNGDIVGPRNMQGGSNFDPDFDIGAGSTQRPGDVNVNWDIGRNLNVYDGRKHLIASFTKDGVDFYVKVRFHGKAVRAAKARRRAR